MLPSQTDVIGLMALADLVVLPSAHEGYPISAIEAMGAGTAVVAFAVGGLAELIDGGVTGRLVRPGSSPELAAAIAELLADPERRARLASAGARAVRTRHRPSVVAERHEQVYF